MKVSKRYLSIKPKDSKYYFKAGNLEFLDAIVVHDWQEFWVQVSFLFDSYNFKEEINVEVSNSDFQRLYSKILMS